MQRKKLQAPRGLKAEVELMTCILIVGLAGSGKTTLTKAYSRWLRENGYEVRVVNLDPGAKSLPYTPDLDVRRYFTVEELMLKHGLGPNGAFVKASEMLLEYSNVLLERISELEASSDYVVVDTPGQMEMFVYRRSGGYFVARLKALGSTLGVFVIDGEHANSPVDLAVSWTTSLLVQLKLDVPMVPVVNKRDLIADVELVRSFVIEPKSLVRILLEEKGLLADVALRLVDLIKEYSRAVRPILLSATREEGLEELHSIAHEIFCTCGDLS
uniref:GTPase n=1 Tax=Fervidicoccus fontis TaxID=683846 RepID=A0A7J3ZIH9_9CREN